MTEKRDSTLIGSFPADEEMVDMKACERGLIIVTNKASYLIPHETMPFLGVYPIRDWEPFRVRP